MLSFTEAELSALYKFFDRGIVGELSPMEVIQVCTRGQLLVLYVADKKEIKLDIEENENATRS